MASPKKVITDFIQDTYKIKINTDYVIIGISGCVPDMHGDLIDNVQVHNKYDDTIGWLTANERYLVKGTVHPGKKYTQAPMNKNGAWYLKNGLYQAVRAKHFGQDAFNIFAKHPIGSVEGYRDTARKGIHPLIQNPKAKVYRDGTGIDIHAGGEDENNVAGHSAGCQVLLGDWNSPAWLGFKEPLYKSKQKIFLYCLFDYSDIKKQIEA